MKIYCCIKPKMLRRGIRGDRKSTRLNSSHGYISYAVFCLKKKNTSNSVPATTNIPSSRTVLNNTRKKFTIYSHRLSLLTELHKRHLSYHQCSPTDPIPISP